MTALLNGTTTFSSSQALASTFNLRITIASKDIDQLGHVNNAVYLHWVQEAVLSYWHHIAPGEATSRLLWVALKHEIKYRVPLFLNDRVDALVTAKEARGSQASFTTLIKRGNELSAEIQSSWCCIDAMTRRPRRLAQEIVRLFLPDTNSGHSTGC